MPGMPIVMAGKNGPDPVDADCPKHGPQCPARVVELASRPQPVQPANRVGRTKTPPHDGAPSLASAAPPTVPHSFTTVSRTPLRCQVSLRGGRPGGVAALRVDLCPADLGPAIVTWGQPLLEKPAVTVRAASLKMPQDLCCMRLTNTLRAICDKGWPPPRISKPHIAPIFPCRECRL
jgi:hypothetical protein